MSLHADNELDEFSNLMEKYINQAGEETALAAVEAGAKEFVNDLLKLPKPISEIHKSGYTHLVDSFAYEVNKSKKEIEVGWGKHYGRMVEKGSVKMKKQPHLEPLWSRNAERYQRLIIEKIFG